MNDILFGKAGPDDFDDILDFIDFVFSQAHVPHDFTALLPKLYKREHFMDGIHYLAREEKKIKAVVGAFPLKIDFSNGISVCGRGIGMVSVHPRARSKGYMKALMNMAHEDMRKDGMAFSCLGGQRQRYEYFGYTPTGTNYYFTVSKANIRHTLGKDWKTSLRMLPVTPADKETLDNIHAIHESKAVKFYRNRDRFFDILSSWQSKIFAIMDGEEFEGYLVCKPGSYDVAEINMKNISHVNEALGIYLRYRNEHGGQDSVQVMAGPQDIEKIRNISRFSESYRQSSACQFNILDFKVFVEPFLKFKAKQRIIADGSFVLKIEGEPGTTLEISVCQGIPEIKESVAAPDLILSHLEAIQFFFAPTAALTIPAIGEKVFLQSLLPLPLFLENLDGV
jgi:predicted N-acetyltransferase YhbS